MPTLAPIDESSVRRAAAIRHRLASFVALLEVLFSVVFAWLLLGQLPSAIQLLGGVLLLGGVMVVRAGEPERGPSDPAEPERTTAANAVASSLARRRQC